MEGNVEKIYCCDHDNSNVLAASILANGRKDDNWPMMAMMNGGGWGNNWMNNPFAYMMFLALFRNGFGGFDGWNGQGQQNVEMQNQLQAIRSQLQDNQNSNLLMDAIKGNDFALSQLAQNLNVDFNTLQKCCCDVQAAIQQVAGQIGFSAERVINAINLGNTGIITAVKDCCCQTQKELIQMNGDLKLQNCQMTGELRNGQRDLGQAITQGFAQSSYETQKQTCDIIAAGTANTQRILDTLNNHWTNEQAREIQDLKVENSQLKQTQYLAKLIQNGGSCTGCGNGLGY